MVEVEHVFCEEKVEQIEKSLTGRKIMKTLLGLLTLIIIFVLLIFLSVVILITYPGSSGGTWN